MGGFNREEYRTAQSPTIEKADRRHKRDLSCRGVKKNTRFALSAKKKHQGIRIILRDLHGNNQAFAFRRFSIVQCYLLFIPVAGKLVGSDHDYVVGVGYLHLPGLHP